MLVFKSNIFEQCVARDDLMRALRLLTIYYIYLLLFVALAEAVPFFFASGMLRNSLSLEMDA